MGKSKVAVICCTSQGIASHPSCVSGVNYEQAQSHCSNLNMTLCSAEQVKNGAGQVEDLVQTRICGFHDALVWTVSRCPSGRRRTSLPSCKGLGGSVYAVCGSHRIKRFKNNADCISDAQYWKTLGNCIPNSVPLMVANLTQDNALPIASTLVPLAKF